MKREQLRERPIESAGGKRGKPLLNEEGEQY